MAAASDRIRHDLPSASDLDHLQERESSFLHAGAAAGGQDDQRQPLAGGPLDGGGEAFWRPDGAGQAALSMWRSEQSGGLAADDVLTLVRDVIPGEEPPARLWLMSTGTTRPAAEPTVSTRRSAKSKSIRFAIAATPAARDVSVAKPPVSLSQPRRILDAFGGIARYAAATPLSRRAHPARRTPELTGEARAPSAMGCSGSASSRSEAPRSPAPR